MELGPWAPSRCSSRSPSRAGLRQFAMVDADCDAANTAWVREDLVLTPLGQGW